MNMEMRKSTVCSPERFVPPSVLLRSTLNGAAVGGGWKHPAITKFREVQVVPFMSDAGGTVRWMANAGLVAEIVEGQMTVAAWRTNAALMTTCS